MKKKFLIWIFALIINLLCQERSDAYSQFVHRRITEAVIKQNIVKLNGYLKEAGFVKGLEEYVIGNSIKWWIEEGSEKEDFSLDPGVLLTSHYYNPLTNKGLTEGGITIGESAYDRANNPTNYWSWKSARENFYRGITSTIDIVREVSLAHSFKALGHTMHLIQDMGVPAHTRDDMHMMNEPYENYTNERRRLLNYAPIPFPYWNASVSTRAPKQFWDLDSYNGSVAYDSGYIGLSEYSHANFFSKDTIFKYFPHPARENTNYYDFGLLPYTVITTPDNVNHNTFYISGYGKQSLAALKYLAEDLWSLPILPIKKYQLTLHLDNRCHEEYAQHLVPRAVGYSAGLLDYFFRGRIEITLPPKGVYAQTENRDQGFTSVTLLAKNTTPYDEEMTNGGIELVVKYRLALEDPFQSYPVPTTWEYSYIVVPELNNTRSIPRANPINLEFDLSQNPVPINATDIYLQVVYKGKLGQEEGAVAVGFKDISEPTPIDIYNSMDRICINGSWYVAGSPEALALGNQFNIDAYPHHLRNIYLRFSPINNPQGASPTDFNLHLPSLDAGDFFIREAFILSDYQFNYGYRVTVVNANPNDPYVTWFDPRVIPYMGIKNQTEYTVIEDPQVCAIYNMSAPCALYMRYYPTFNSFRDQEMWRGIAFPNASYPPGSVCP